jgi:AcrR family transcriptional regulator
MLVITNMKTTRPYTMGARAQAAAATRQRVLDAATALLRERLRVDIRLEDVAALAQVSEMTVLRLFRTKAALLEAALEAARAQIVAQRQEAAPGDVAGSIRCLLEHYEQLGDLVVANLAQESSDASIAALVRMGRDDHDAWVRRQFGPQLRGRPRKEREQLVDALVVACDVYVWKRLRRDTGRSLEQCTETVRRLVEGVLDARAAEPV